MSMAALPPVPDADMFRRELLHVTRSLQTIVHAGVMPICQRHSLTAQQMYVLIELLDEPGQSAGQLSDRAGILRTNFSAVCHKLEERGLVERRRSARDKRAFELRITDEGRSLLRSIDEEVKGLYGPVFEAESPETFATILTGFRALRDFSERLGR